MKRVYIFGRIVRISFLIAFAFLIYAFVDIYIESYFEFTYLLLLIIIVGIVIYGLIWIYSMGLFFDEKNNKLNIVAGFSKENRKERILSDVNSLDVELNDDLGMSFIINYKSNYTEKIGYKFYRISFLEQSQYKRIKKQLVRIKQTITN